MAIFRFGRKNRKKSDKTPKRRLAEYSGAESEYEMELVGSWQPVYYFIAAFARPIRMPKPDAFEKALAHQLEYTDLVIGQLEREHSGERTCSWMLYGHQDSTGHGDRVCQLSITGPEIFDAEKWKAAIQLWHGEKRHELSANQLRYSLTCSCTTSDSLCRVEQYGMIAHCADVILQQFPDCIGIYWPHSQKLVTREFYRTPHWHSPELHFLDGGLHVRCLYDTDSNEELVDTLGLTAIGLPDLQCRCEGLDPARVAGFLRSVAAYLYQNGDVINDGDTLEGVDGGRWPCQHGNSLAKPRRRVLEICPVRPEETVIV